MENLTIKKENLDDKLIDDDLAREANLTWAGSDNEGNDVYIGSDKEWAKYEELETIKNKQ